MTKSELSVFMFGLYYIFAIGMPFMFFPNFALGLFGLGAGDGVWVRILGLFVSIMGAYYLLAVRAEIELFYGWTVPSRYATALMQVLMAGLGLAGPALLLFAAFDAAAATLTWAALRSERAAEQA